MTTDVPFLLSPMSLARCTGTGHHETIILAEYQHRRSRSTKRSRASCCFSVFVADFDTLLNRSACRWQPWGVSVVSNHHHSFPIIGTLCTQVSLQGLTLSQIHTFLCIMGAREHGLRECCHGYSDIGQGHVRSALGSTWSVGQCIPVGPLPSLSDTTLQNRASETLSSPGKTRMSGQLPSFPINASAVFPAAAGRISKSQPCCPLKGWETRSSEGRADLICSDPLLVTD